MNSCSQPKCGKPSYSAYAAVSKRDAWPNENFALAMAYVPMQHFKTVYGLDEALQCGTIFPELDKPFMGQKGGHSC